ncbi:DEAD/DEAH box helicase [Bacillus taeanensis]
MKTFYEFGLQNKTVKALSGMGFETATPIQAETIPVALSGKDLIGQAQTGTGKTTAFGVPLIEKADVEAPFVQGLVLTPTRELAVQVAEELNRIGQQKGVRTLPVYGGQDINRQIRALKKVPQIIVGTPGRLIDHIKRKTIKLMNVQTVVLDEADEMLNMGFIEDIEMILQEVPSPHQTLLFSATMPKQIQALAEKFMHEPEIIKVKAKALTVKNIDQQYIEVQEQKKFDALCRLLDIQSPELAIIFGRTKKRVDELSEALMKRGYSAQGIHGDLSQAKRDQVIRRFKEQTIEIMVATDVAARGLDISGVTHVYNFDIPQDPESYVHRIGRTGRAGNKGLAVTFVTPREIDHLRTIEKVSKTTIDRQPVPSYQDVIVEKQQEVVGDMIKAIEKGSMTEYKGTAERLLEEYDSVSLLSAALKILTKEPNQTPIRLTEVAPLRSKKSQNKSFASKRKNDRKYDRKNDRKNDRDRDRNKRFRAKRSKTK